MSFGVRGGVGAQVQQRQEDIRESRGQPGLHGVKLEEALCHTTGEGKKLQPGGRWRGRLSGDEASIQRVPRRQPLSHSLSPAVNRNQFGAELPWRSDYVPYLSPPQRPRYTSQDFRHLGGDRPCPATGQPPPAFTPSL